MVAEIRPGTFGESVISNPRLPMLQDIAPSESSTTVDPEATRRSRGFADGVFRPVRTAAAEPSAKRALATIFSGSQP